MVTVCSSMYGIYIYRVNQSQVERIGTEKQSNECETRPGVNIKKSKEKSKND